MYRNPFEYGHLLWWSIINFFSSCYSTGDVRFVRSLHFFSRSLHFFSIPFVILSMKYYHLSQLSVALNVTPTPSLPVTAQNNDKTYLGRVHTFAAEVLDVMHTNFDLAVMAAIIMFSHGGFTRSNLTGLHHVPKTVDTGEKFLNVARTEICIGFFVTDGLKLQFLSRGSPSFQHGLLLFIRLLSVNVLFHVLYRVLLDISSLTLILWKELIVTSSW